MNHTQQTRISWGVWHTFMPLEKHEKGSEVLQKVPKQVWSELPATKNPGQRR